MKDLQELFNKVTEWAAQRNLIDGSTAKNQFCKLVEENYEIKTAENNKELLKEIGDYHVVSIIMLAQLGFSSSDYVELVQSQNVYSWSKISGFIAAALAKDNTSLAFIAIVRGMNYANAFLPESFNIYDAVYVAFKKIEHRKGQMIDGVFVKESDL